ncbi:MAG TPA: hypothetical protein PKY58_02160 [Syntrophales bacterium]|nr:hypothetical protein [Syntrophales bacterium]HQN77316.1 hypothetical protein [Syntrophales bacterium]HQQ26304.1 hypothetical protein [Syntrophales bacterium]
MEEILADRERPEKKPFSDPLRNRSRTGSASKGLRTSAKNARKGGDGRLIAASAGPPACSISPMHMARPSWRGAVPNLFAARPQPGICAAVIPHFRKFLFSRETPTPAIVGKRRRPDVFRYRARGVERGLHAFRSGSNITTGGNEYEVQSENEDSLVRVCFSADHRGHRIFDDMDR